MRLYRSNRGARLIAAAALLAMIVAFFIYVDRPPGPEEAVVEKTQEAVNTVEVNREPSPSMKSIDEAQIDSNLIGYKKPNDSAILLEIKKLRAKDWLVGDQFSVVIPHTGYVLETQIEEVRELAPGVTTIKSYPDETMANHILLTVSEKNTFMSLFTPDGEYELVGGQEYGWLVPSASLPGPTADDFVLVEGPILREAPPEIVRVPTDG